MNLNKTKIRINYKPVFGYPNDRIIEPFAWLNTDCFIIKLLFKVYFHNL